MLETLDLPDARSVLAAFDVPVALGLLGVDVPAASGVLGVFDVPGAFCVLGVLCVLGPLDVFGPVDLPGAFVASEGLEVVPVAAAVGVGSVEVTGEASEAAVFEASSALGAGA